MNRKRGILAAGTFTGLVILTLLALGWGDFANLRAANVESVDGAAVELPQTDGMSEEEALRAWQEYSQELEATVRTMQDREGAYQEQLQMANETITQLTDEINNGRTSYAEDDEYEEYEEYDDHFEDEDDDDHYEDDDDEHEEYEHGDDDDD
jgi:hypothetical protein